MHDIVVHASEADKGWGDCYYGVISNIINENNFKSFAEIGVAFGGHLEEILTNTSLQTAYAVDSYSLTQTTTDSFRRSDGVPFDQSDYENLFQFANDRLQKFGNRIIFIRDSSLNSLDRIESLDMVFVDAEHSYDAVVLDLNIWYDKINYNGIISGHDYDHPNFPGVKIAVDEFIERNNLKLNVCKGYVWWARAKQ